MTNLESNQGKKSLAGKIVLSVLIISLVTVIHMSIFDKSLQVDREIQSLKTMSSEERLARYGQEVNDLYELYDSGEYAEPLVYNFDSIIDNHMVIMAFKYDTDGSAIDQKQTSLILKFRRIPVLNIDLLEDILPGDMNFN